MVLDEVKQEFHTAYMILPYLLSSHLNFGKNIYDMNWDLLIILDACRFDALREVSDKYSFINNMNIMVSKGSHSKEWLLNTFVDDRRPDINDTTLITANSFSKTLERERIDPLSYPATANNYICQSGALSSFLSTPQIRSHDFDTYISLFEKNLDDSDNGQLRPEILTDIAINHARDVGFERMILHYMQPHKPYFERSNNRGVLGSGNHHQNPFDYLKETGDYDLVWNSYIENLRFVLDSVELLIENIDAEKVVITADHGELFGEWGFHGHPPGVLHPSLRKVPVVRTAAQDKSTHDPRSYDLTQKASENEITSRLKALGYQ